MIEEIEPKIKCHKQYISSKLAKPHEELFALYMWLLLVWVNDWLFPYQFISRGSSHGYYSILTLCEKCPHGKFFLARIFPHSDWIVSTISKSINKIQWNLARVNDSISKSINKIQWNLARVNDFINLNFVDFHKTVNLTPCSYFFVIYFLCSISSRGSSQHMLFFLAVPLVIKND